MLQSDSVFRSPWINDDIQNRNFVLEKSHFLESGLFVYQVDYWFIFYQINLKPNFHFCSDFFANNSSLDCSQAIFVAMYRFDLKKEVFQFRAPLQIFHE